MDSSDSSVIGDDLHLEGIRFPAKAALSLCHRKAWLGVLTNLARLLERGACRERGLQVDVPGGNTADGIRNGKARRSLNEQPAVVVAATMRVTNASRLPGFPGCSFRVAQVAFPLGLWSGESWCRWSSHTGHGPDPSRGQPSCRVAFYPSKSESGFPESFSSAQRSSSASTTGWMTSERSSTEA